ncbi:MAG: alpha/beta hydrolase [Tissierellia bacterium]|nr:alpha/beta hydrolase [Tissierellia bacterium]
MKILIIHGWMNSQERYRDLGSRLQDVAQVEYYEFPGFGSRAYGSFRFNILEKYREDLSSFLRGRSYDLIVTHSMGGNILLRVLEREDVDARAILFSNTAYFGVDSLKPLAWCTPIPVAGLVLFRMLPQRFAWRVAKKIAHGMFHRYKSYDEITFHDVRRANPMAAGLCLTGLTYDRFRYSGRKRKAKFYVSYSEEDWEVSRKKTDLLIRDLNPLGVCSFPGGHMVALEAKEAYEKFLRRLLRTI